MPLNPKAAKFMIEQLTGGSIDEQKCEYRRDAQAEGAETIEGTFLHRIVVGKRKEGVWMTGTSIDVVVDEYELSDPFRIKVVFHPMLPEGGLGNVQMTAHFPREAFLGIIESESKTVIQGFSRKSSRVKK